MSLPTVLFLAPAAVCVAAWCGAGAIVPPRRLPSEPLLAALTVTGVGATVFAVATFAAGRVGLFHEWLLAAATVALAPVGVWRMLPLLRRLRLPPGRTVRILLALTALALLLDLVAASAPPTSADALKYHLALPEQWLERGSIGDTFWRYEGFSPFAVEMLYAQGLSLGGGEVAGVLGAVFAVLCAGAVYGLARELGGGDVTAAALAAALFTLQGLVTWVATSSFVDLGMAFYAALAAWYVLRARTTGATCDIAFAGLAAGGAAGVKYVGLLAGALALAPLLAVLAVRRRWRVAVVCVGAAIAAAFPWYLKNLLVTGNPLYPLLFGGKMWDALAQAEVDGLANYGVGGPPLRLAILPLDLLVSGDRFDRGQYAGTAILVLAPLALLRRPRRPVVVLLVAVAAFLVVWWELSPQARYLLPALAVLAAAAGVGGAELLRRGQWAARAAVALLAVAVAAWAAASGALTRKLLPVTIGAESRPHFVQRLTGTYDALQRTAHDVRGTAAIAGYLQIYYYPRQAIALGQPEFGPDISQAELLRRLHGYGVTEIVVGRGEPGKLLPLQGCVRQLHVYSAHVVVSRTRGGSYPYRFIVYRPTCGPYAP